MSASLGCFLVGFVVWMLGNPDFYHRDLRYWFSMTGEALILLGDVGLMVSMVVFSRRWAQVTRFSTFVLAATLLSIASYAILFLEYGVFNFGDSDMPPFQPDTPFEKAFDFVWLAVTIGGLLIWLLVIIFVIAQLCRYVRRQWA